MKAAHIEANPVRWYDYTIVVLGIGTILFFFNLWIAMKWIMCRFTRDEHDFTVQRNRLGYPVVRVCRLCETRRPL